MNFKLTEKYKDKYKYLRNVSEHILLIQGKVIKIFADVSGYPDGVCVHILDIIAPDKRYDIELIKK